MRQEDRALRPNGIEKKYSRGQRLLFSEMSVGKTKPDLIPGRCLPQSVAIAQVVHGLAGI